MWKKVFDWLDERLGLNDIYKNLLDRPEPKGNDQTKLVVLLYGW